MSKSKKNKQQPLEEILVLDEELTIQNASEIKEKMLELLNQTDHLVIDQKSAKEMDISYLQLLLALRKSVESSGKSLSIITGENQSLFNLMKNAGYPESKWFKTNPVISNNEGGNNE